MSVYFGYGNILETGTITFSSEATGYPGYRVHDKDVSLPWKATSIVDQSIIVDMGDGETASINRWIVTNHNLKGATLYLDFTDDYPGGSPSWTQKDTYSPSNNDTINRTFSSSNHRAFRLRIVNPLNEPSSWDLLDENCSSLSNWTDSDNINGVSEVSPAGQFRMDANAAAANNKAGRYRVLSSCPNTFTLEIKLYHSALGLLLDQDKFFCRFCQSDESLTLEFSSDGICVYDTVSGHTEVGTDLVKYGGSAEWQIWRFVVTFTDVTGAGTCDVYLKDSTHDWVEVGTAIPCSQEASYSVGRIEIEQRGYTTDNMLSHVDYIKVVSGLYPMTPPEISELYLGNSIEIKNPIYSPDTSPQYIRTREETQSGVPWIIENGSSKDSFAGNFNRLTEAQKNYILAACEETSFFFIDHDGILRYVEVKGLRVIKSIAPGTYFDVYVDFLEIEAV